MIAVTGATGHVGANLVRALLARGEKLRVLVRDDDRSIAGLDVERVTGDVRDQALLAQLFDGCDLVYHLAAKISLVRREAPLTHSINIEGPRAVAAACLATGVRRLVHFSSIHAFSPHPRDGAVDEERPLTSGRVPHYDLSKAAGEREIRAAIDRGLDAVIVNPTSVIGPHDYAPSAMGQVFLDLYHRRLPALVEGGFDWVDVRDVVAGAIAAAERGRRGDKFLLSGHHAPVRELAAIAARVTAVPAPRFVSPMWLARAGLPFAAVWAAALRRPPQYTSASLHALRNHQRVSHEKAARELGYAPRPLDATVADIYAWFRDAGMLAPASAPVSSAVVQ